MFILTEHTPNPDAMKFTPDAPLTAAGGWAFNRRGFDPRQSPLAARLFALAGVEAVYIAPQFLTVTRSPAGQPWASLRAQVIASIAEHLESGAASVSDEAIAEAVPVTAEVTDEDIEAEIRSVLALWVKPGVARDGGDILFDRFDAPTGVLWIRMQGACGGCPSSQLTLKAGVERLVRRYVPEVLRVEEVVDAAAVHPSRLESWAARLPARAGASIRPVFTHRGREIASDRPAGAAAPPP